MAAMGYRARTSFLTGLTVAQVSEFSLILVVLGMSLGHVGPEVMGLTILVALITISVPTYIILNSQQLYDSIGVYLRAFERRAVDREAELSSEETATQVDVILFGVGRFGAAVGRELQQVGLRVLGVDFDPQAVEAMRRAGFSVCFSDGSDPEFLVTLPLSRARWVFTTVRDTRTNQGLLSGLREQGYQGKVVITAHTSWEAEDMGALRPT